MKIAIVHQYPDFKRTVFYQLLQQESKTPLQEVSPDKAALIVYGPFGRFPKIVGRFVKRKASIGPRVFKNRSAQPVSLFHTIENVRHENKYDFSIGYDFPIRDCDYRFPYWMESLDWSHEGVARPSPLRISQYFQIAELLDIRCHDVKFGLRVTDADSYHWAVDEELLRGDALRIAGF